MIVGIWLCKKLSGKLKAVKTKGVIMYYICLEWFIQLPWRE